MMLDVDFAEFRQGFLQYLPVGAIVGLIIVVELVLAVGAWTASPGAGAAAQSRTPSAAVVSNTEALGRVLYTDYVFFFQAAGLILLVAMIGAIVLTLRHKPGVRRQVVAEQVARRSNIEIRKISPGQGL
jgi:NADH-quinone oxidoreductase subunit J